ncbi:MAG: hypothetical protein AMXMBFR76_02240 [Pseudomonadota bacterium]
MQQIDDAGGPADRRIAKPAAPLDADAVDDPGPQRSQLLTQRVEFGAICILRNVGIARHGAILVWAVDIPPAYDRQVTI